MSALRSRLASLSLFLAILCPLFIAAIPVLCISASGESKNIPLMVVSIVLLGTFMILTELTGIAVFTAVGTALMIVGLGVGLGMSFYAMKKYNKGIF